MRERYSASPRVVVGIDGSRAAMQAAIWALDEGVDRDIPLSLLYAIDSTSNDPNDTAAEVVAAENIVRTAITTIESLGKQVKLETEIVHRHPVAALLEASRSAAMVCVGSVGFKHAMQGRIGSTASALAASAHCPVTIVPRTAGTTSTGAGVVLAVVDGSPASNTVLERSVAEAQLRHASLRVFIRRQPRGIKPGDIDVAVEAIPRVTAELEHRLTHWRRNHPHLDIELVSDHSGLLNYLEHLQRNAAPIRLVVVDPLRPGPAELLLRPSGRALLEAAGCALMICEKQWWL